MITLNERGHRKSENGLYYGSDTEYELYLSDRLLGHSIESYGLDPCWLAIHKCLVLSRHRTKNAALKACLKHQKQNNALPKNARKTKRVTRSRK